MTLSEEVLVKLGKYNWRLTIENKLDPTLGITFEMNGKENLSNVFLEEVLNELADDLTKGEEEFEDYKKRGVIVKGKDGGYDLNNHSAQGLAGEGVTIDNNESIEIVKHRKDLKGGIIED